MKDFGIYTYDGKLGYFYNPKEESGVGVKGLEINKSYIHCKLQDIIVYLFLRIIHFSGVRKSFK